MDDIDDDSAWVPGAFGTGRFRKPAVRHGSGQIGEPFDNVPSTVPGWGWGSSLGARRSGGASRTSFPTVNNIGLTDDQVLAGSSHPQHAWFNATIDSIRKTISVDINVNFLSRDLTDEQMAKLTALAQQGVAKFWSRTIHLNGHVYTVKVSLNPTINGMNIWLEINNGDSYKRSFDTKGTNSPLSLPGAVIYYQPGFWEHRYEEEYKQRYGRNWKPDSNFMKMVDQTASEDFQETAAHEIGHSFLTIAGGVEFSWGHEGTSGVTGGGADKNLPAPATGSMDMMKYYQRKNSVDMYSTAIGSEDDVKTLIYVSSHAYH